MSLPIPDAKQVSALRKYIVEYVIFALIAAVVILFKMVVDLNNDIRNDFILKLWEANKAIDRASNTTDDFLRYQRFERPLRNGEIDAPPAVNEFDTMYNRKK